MDYDLTYSNLEKMIRNNEWKSKEELSRYIIDLKNRNLITQEQISQLLSIYDELNQSSNMPLNMENYKGVGLGEQNFIVSTQTDQILKTMESHENISKEFKNVQNEIIANSEDAKTNADTIYNHMANNQKEEVNLISLYEIFTRKNIDIEMLQKIKFFINNKYINPYSYKVDITNGIFYNVETSEILEVRKNPNTNEYQIYKGSEIVYGDSYQKEETQEVSDDLIEDANEEEQLQENRNKPKTRVLRYPQSNHYGNAAFSKIDFLVLNVIIFGIIITLIALLDNFLK